MIFLRRLFLYSTLILILGWAGYFIGGNALGHSAVNHFGKAVDRLGGCKVPDQAQFVTLRLREFLTLISIAWLTGLIAIGILKFQVHQNRYLSVFCNAILLFVVLNFSILAAGKTALFWLILRGTTVDNQAQFHTKENLLREIKIHPRIALVGSSQARTQIKQEQFNEYARGRAWLMEFHFPGCRSADVFLLSNRFSATQVNEFVYYVSPSYFYIPESDSAIARDLLRLRDLPITLAMNAWQHFPSQTRPYAALGMAIPLFQYRSALQHAIFGNPDFVLPSATPPSSKPIVNDHLSARGLSTSGPEVAYQKAAFHHFLEHTAEKGQHVIVIGGQLNPAAEAVFAPNIRPDYERFLKECAQSYPNMTLIWQNELLIEPPEAYDDDVHVSEKTAEIFTAAFAKWYFDRK